MFGGDDLVIKRSVGIIAVLAFILIVFVFSFGVIQIAPKNTNRDNLSNCTIQYKPVWINRFFSINEPLLPRHCTTAQNSHSKQP